MSLLELRNTPRDDELGSRMHRLMGRMTKTLVPITNALRKPNAGPYKTKKVASKLLEYRYTHKFYYDRNTRVNDGVKP
ncbi:hypothetical protein DPMN_029735 [Dreissena polymorpha]|uniref:Uncharacterized protein n=1 Tax=Dreissena polymorpha TaxID=45954 RepID=A0A9D4LZR8_DREPO|nr:hypothetical protein DPMN_029735 [Dreissena polymorpha]